MESREAVFDVDAASTSAGKLPHFASRWRPLSRSTGGLCPSRGLLGHTWLYAQQSLPNPARGTCPANRW